MHEIKKKNFERNLTTVVIQDAQEIQNKKYRYHTSDLKINFSNSDST